MDGPHDEPFVVQFPLWHVVHRKPWLDGENASSLFEYSAFKGELIPVFFTDQHLAVKYVDDANTPELCAILVRDAVEMVRLIEQFHSVGVQRVAFDAEHPRSKHERYGWFVPLPHLLDRIRGGS